MSKLFKFPDVFVRQGNLNANNCGNTDAAKTPNAEHCNSATNENRSVLLRDDHVVLWAIDGLLALHAAFVKWRNHRRTFRALADLDEEQLWDIGLTRDSPMLAKHKSYRALAELDDTQLYNLSERGLQARREARRAGL